MEFVSINPANGERIATYEEMPVDAVSDVLRKMHGAFLEGREKPIGDRSDAFHRLSVILKERKNGLALLMAQEMGKPLDQGRAEIDKCAWLSEYYADFAETFLQTEPMEAGGSKSYIMYQPLGVILAVMPWNFPFWQVFRSGVSAIMAGNTILLKHAPSVCGCAMAIEDLFNAADFPVPVLRSLIVDVERVPGIIDDPRVAAVTLTGSPKAGSAVAARAGASLKKCILELGGSDSYLVLEDADVKAAAEICVSSRLINSGQSCIAAKRFIVVDPVREKFESLFVEKMRSRNMGDPVGDDIDLGPIARRDLRDALHDQVVRSVDQGARLLLGGEIPEGKGFFYPPTVLTDVRKGQPVFDEETFGPVGAIIPAADEDEAVRLANDSPYGLGAAVFTKNALHGEEVASRLDVGNVYVNDFVKSDPRLPFGGIKKSGHGRELSVTGIRELVNVKSVWVK